MMMPQREAGESTNGQKGPTYGRYEGDQAYTHQQYQDSFEQPLRGEPVGKVYPPLHNNKNTLRLIVFAIAMATLLAFAVLCLVFVRGTGGWISFCAASLAILTITATAIDKIK